MAPHAPKFRKTVLREQDAEATRADLYRDIMSNLSQPLKKIPSKYLYDDAGSGAQFKIQYKLLFTCNAVSYLVPSFPLHLALQTQTAIYAQITDLKSYYLTAAEREILSMHASTIIDEHILPHPGPLNVVELGAGDGRKTRILLNALLKSDVQFEYLPIDISAGAMSALFESLRATFSESPLRVHGIIADYEQGLEHAVRMHPDRRTLVLFLGSSIGNFTPSEAHAFLTMIRSRLRESDLMLLGCDLKKDPTLLQAAYDDSERVTVKFNLNLLTRLNRELGANFDISCFAHHAMYDPAAGCMKSFLLSRKAHHVYFSGCPHGTKDTCFFFAKWEPIFTEYSFKYGIGEVHSMLSESGIIPVADFSDGRGWFLDTVAQVRKKEAK